MGGVKWARGTGLQTEARYLQHSAHMFMLRGADLCMTGQGIQGWAEGEAGYGGAWRQGVNLPGRGWDKAKHGGECRDVGWMGRTG